jgi:hypothetical protein
MKTSDASSQSALKRFVSERPRSFNENAKGMSLRVLIIGRDVDYREIFARTGLKDGGPFKHVSFAILIVARHAFPADDSLAVLKRTSSTVLVRVNRNAAPLPPLSTRRVVNEACRVEFARRTSAHARACRRAGSHACPLARVGAERLFKERAREQRVGEAERGKETGGSLLVR